MKKHIKRIVICFFILTASAAGAFENFDLKWNVGNIGLNWNFQKNNDYILDTYFDLFNFAIEHSRSRIGLEISPAKRWSWDYEDENGDKVKQWSFANLNVLWNIFNLHFDYTRSIFSGDIFAGLNYLYLTDKGLSWNDYVFTAGFRLRWALVFGRNIYYNLVGSEIGYRSHNGFGAFYIGLNIDIALLFGIIFSTIVYRER